MTERVREPYEPPTVQRVRFAPGEVAAAACKAQPGPPPFTGRCNRGNGVFVSKNFGS